MSYALIPSYLVTKRLRVHVKKGEKAMQAPFSSVLQFSCKTCSGEAIGWIDLSSGIDLGPGSNQPLHHLQMAILRDHHKRCRAILRCEAGQAEGRWT